jgi:hypothetical protein
VKAYILPKIVELGVWLSKNFCWTFFLMKKMKSIAKHAHNIKTLTMGNATLTKEGSQRLFTTKLHHLGTWYAHSTFILSLTQMAWCKHHNLSNLNNKPCSTCNAFQFQPKCITMQVYHNELKLPMFVSQLVHLSNVFCWTSNHSFKAKLMYHIANLHNKVQVR